MFDLTTMRMKMQDEAVKSQVKTFLSPAAKRRVKEAADFVGVPQHAIIEQLIMDYLPDPNPPTPRRPGQTGHKFPTEK